MVLEGKYWKRKLEAVTAEYKRWRLFYRNRSLGHTPKEILDPVNTFSFETSGVIYLFLFQLNEMDMMLALDSSSTDMMMIDEDYMGLMSDTLFSTIVSQPYVFPDSREIGKYF